ncbi:MAG: DUF58 domain-containing protein [Pseudomonadota bacterium]
MSASSNKSQWYNNTSMKDSAKQYVYGAYTQLSHLIDAQLPAKFIAPQWRQSRALAAGSYRSNFRGRGLEFEDVRAYQAGDDVRTIDWRVTARSGKAHTKTFREEHERPVLLCVDQRMSNFIGSQHCFKSTMSATLSALIAWSGTQNKDRVGGLVFNDDTHQMIKPKSTKKIVLQYLQTVCDYNQQLTRDRQIHSIPSQSLLRALEQLQLVAKTSASVFIISDFHGFDEPCVRKLLELCKHNNVFCIQVMDLIEHNMPTMSHAVFGNGKTTLKLNTQSSQFKQRYQDSFEQQQQFITDTFKQYAIPFVQCYTHDEPLHVLRQHLRKG